jgi:hypothetical protein
VADDNDTGETCRPDSCVESIGVHQLHQEGKPSTVTMINNVTLQTMSRPVWCSNHRYSAAASVAPDVQFLSAL